MRTDTERRWVHVGWNELVAWPLDDPLPSPAEQADRFVLWIGDHQPSTAEPVEISAPEVSAWIGVAITSDNSNDELAWVNNPENGLNWLFRQEEIKRFVEHRGMQNGRILLRLTMAGWTRYEAIKHAQVESRAAFMAMQFGDEALNHAVDNYFKQAIARAGYVLCLLSDSQPAGLIDDQLRVRLRNSRFVIADLTHANNGAYWEAGFAEGLGRPVIYTCRKKEWDELDEDGRRKVHFDTNHLVTIIWDPENLADATTRLTATIRATLPGEAKMTD